MKRSLVTLSLLLGGVLLSGCVDEKIIRERGPIFTEPQASALNFVGYSDEEEKLTVCGNCHIDHQELWRTSGHADAWEGLQASGHAADYCQDCHTVGQLGNQVEGKAGFAATKESRYYDVQCESCHGAGLPHIRNPRQNPVLAPVNAAIGPAGPNQADAGVGCGECHNGTHHPFVEEWAASPHGQIPHASSPAGRAECRGCHVGEAALRMLGVRSNTLENLDSLINSGTANMAITCAVCHDPHGNQLRPGTEGTPTGQLRFPVQTSDIDSHLCAQCHNRRNFPATGSTHGLEPHSPESALLVGDAGFFFPGSTSQRRYGSHGPGGNPRLCATCHVTTFDVTDKATGQFRMTTTGHLFNAVPCVDANGVPQPRTQNCAMNETARSFKGCLGSGCHQNAKAAADLINTVATRLQTLADEVEHMLEIIDPTMLGAGGAINPTDQTISVAEGAFFNVELALFQGSAAGPIDPTRPTIRTWGAASHNALATEGLLLESKNALCREYRAQLQTGGFNCAAATADRPQMTVPARLR